MELLSYVLPFVLPIKSQVCSGPMFWLVPAMWLAHSLIEAYIGRQARKSNLPFGSLLGLVMFLGVVITWRLKQAKGGKKND